MKCYEINTVNTTYYARVLPGRFAHDPMLAAAYPQDRATVTVYGGRFGVIEAVRLPAKGDCIYGESSGGKVRTSPVLSVRRISKKRFAEVA
jgi:hypothetical protein